MSERRTCRHLVIPAAALLFQAVPPVLFLALAVAAHAETPRLPEACVQPLSMLTLAFAAGASWTLGIAGAYGLLTRARPTVAAGMILFCCLPAILAGAVYLHAWLVFMARV